MASKVPVVKQMAWIAIVPQLIIMGLMMAIFYPLSEQYFILLGAALYTLLSYLLRYAIAKEHRKGMQQVKQGKFKDAIPCFELSYTFFKKNDFLDKYRFIFLLSAARMTYKEMALNNIAFCYGQIGNGKLAKKYYQRTLDEYPNSGMAQVGMNLLNAAAKED
jgi:tetratricopeptide (TPR) repeat protein